MGRTVKCVLRYTSVRIARSSARGWLATEVSSHTQSPQHRINQFGVVESPPLAAARTLTYHRMHTHTANIGFVDASASRSPPLSARRGHHTCTLATTLAPWPHRASAFTVVAAILAAATCNSAQQRYSTPHTSMGLDDHAPCLQHTERVQAKNS